MMIHVEYGFTETKNVLILPIRPNDNHAHTNLSVGGTGYRWANYGREGAAIPSGPDNSVLVTSRKLHIVRQNQAASI
jgi:hypothetical protein